MYTCFSYSGDRGLEQVKFVTDRFESGVVPSLKSVSESEGLVQYIREALNVPDLTEDEVHLSSVDYFCRCSKDQYSKLKHNITIITY